MQTSTTRLETFSDAVVAIIMTIMILELKLPEFNKDQDEYDIHHHLVELLPHFGAYVFSFIMIGILWANHHHMFNLLGKTDNILLGQNLFFLFWMSLIPFVTGIVGANPRLPTSIALYGFVMLMTTLSLAIMRSYTMKKNLVHTDEEKAVDKKINKVSTEDRTKSYIGAAAYLLSVPLAFVSVYISFVCFVIPVILFLWPAGVDEERLAEKVIEKNK
jgi:uncharacterized membrane protein